MASRMEYIEKILNMLGKLEASCRVNESLGLYDINREMEQVFCGVLNVVLGADLKCLNVGCVNFPAVDLGDIDHRIAVQITTQNHRQKIKDTLRSFFHHNLDAQYSRLIILMIGHKGHYSPLPVERGFDFSVERDIWDLSRLMCEVMKQERKELEQILGYLEGAIAPEVGPIVPSFENLHKVLKLIRENLENDSEEFWHTEIFKKYPWILSMIFPGPYMFLEDKAYVGGKGLSNKGGNIADFVYKNDLSNNVALIEIKTSCTPITTDSYRGTYTFGTELMGAVNQVLNYRDKLTKAYYSLVQGEKPFDAFSPKCVVIIGKLSSMTVNEIAAFENYRNILSGITIMTFDEVYLKIKHIVDTFIETCK